MPRRASLPLRLLPCLAPSGPVWAQSQITTGVIQGTVVDQTGAVVPGAEIEARSLGQNVARSLTTGSDGRFVFLQLAPDRYRETITKRGFATRVQANVPLTVGQP